MPIAMIVLTITDPPGQLRVACGLSFTGNYPTGGDTLDLTTIIGQGHLSKIAVFNNGPVDVDAALGGGYDAEFIPGNALNNGKLKIFSSGGTELSAGSYASNAALLAASLNSTIEFVFDKLL